MTDICYRLQEWGCDIPGTMRRFLNDEELYIKCLGTMIRDNNFSLLKKHLEDNNIPEAFNAAHSLKGTLGNMGLTPLYVIIIKIVEILRVGSVEGVSELIEELFEQKKILDSIAS